MFLASAGKKVLRNKKNYNNGLGHPLTVLELAKDKSLRYRRARNGNVHADE